MSDGDQQVPDIDYVHKGPRYWHVGFRSAGKLARLETVRHTSEDPVPGCVKILGPDRRSGQVKVCEVRVPRGPGRGEDRAARAAREVVRQQEGGSP